MNRRAIRQLLLLGLLCTLAACSQPGPPNVVVIVLDTVRPDHLSCYGYERDTSPNIDAFAAGATRYTQARSTAPWTLPSHASLFTGLFPFQHKADAFKDARGVVQDARALPDDATTLAEVLAGEGYATGGFAANRGYLGESSGLQQGFQHFVCEKRDPRDKRDAQTMTKLALDWLATVERDKPVFLFLNYMDAHRRYNNTPLDGARASELRPPPEGENSEQYLDELCRVVLGTNDAPSPELVQKTKDAYDLGIANLDIGVGQLLDGLKSSGRFRDSVIVICADHGEYFGEHDLVEHSKDVYETAVRIPLIVKGARQVDRRVSDELISIADVPRLVLSWFPLEFTAKHLARFPGSIGLGGTVTQIAFTRPKDLSAPWGARFQRERAALYEGRYKLIRSTDGNHELYDLQADPTEQHDLFATKPTEAAALMKRLEQLERSAPTIQAAQSAREATPDELKALRETGYAGEDD